MGKMQKFMESRKVGIVINSTAHIFSSGMIQHAYYMKQTIENIGLKCDFLSVENDPPKFGYKDIQVKQLSTSSDIFNPSDYCLIITFSTGLLKEEYNMFKKAKVAIVSYLICNSLYQDESMFISDSVNIKAFISGSWSDELWILPHFMFQQKYFETIRGRPSLGVPMLWSNEIIEQIALKDNTMEQLTYNPSLHTTRKLNVLITEPNMFFIKNAWFPLVACDYFNILNPSIINEVFAFNWPTTKNADKMTDSLGISKKIRRFNRLPITEIFVHFNKLEQMPIVVSHTHNNGLNYAHYECLYYGYPLVHNCPELEDCGYYYPGDDMEACGKAILQAAKYHNANLEKYIETAKKFLSKIHPKNTDIMNIYSETINSAIRKFSGV